MLPSGAMRAAALIVVMLSCAKQAQPEQGEHPVDEPGAEPAGAPVATGVAWVAKSFDGTATLEQSCTGEVCRAHCTPKGAEGWTREGNIGSRDDAVFLTRDCERLILVIGQPEATKRWTETVVLVAYERGTVEKSYLGGPMLAESAVEKRGSRYHWLKDAAHYMRGGLAAEFTVLNGRTTRLPFREGVALEETYLNDRVTPPDRPVQRPRYEGTYVPPPTAGARASPSQPAPPPPQPERAYTLRVRTSNGFADIPVQAPPTIMSKTGDPTVCRTEREGCGTNADCCGGNCKGGTCQ